MRLANQTGHRGRKVRTGHEGRMASATNHVRGDGQTDGDKMRDQGYSAIEVSGQNIFKDDVGP